MIALPPPILAPPARYMQTSAPAVIINYPPDIVEQVCRRWGRGEPACAFVNGVGRCVIVIPAMSDWQGTPAVYALTLRHEQGHCNGWPADHPR